MRVVFILFFLVVTRDVWGLKIHGNWCGPYHPTNAQMTGEELPHPINFTDISCRLHDFNYVNYDNATQSDEVNAWYRIYPFDQQLEVDRLLIRDIEWGLKHSDLWGCEANFKSEKRHDFSVRCQTPKLHLSTCNRNRPNWHESVKARVVQLGMYIKVTAGYYLGRAKPDYKVCSSVQETPTNEQSEQLLSFVRPMVFMEEPPSFCEIQAEYASQTRGLNDHSSADRLKAAFQFFEGRQNKIDALKTFNQLLRECELDVKSLADKPLINSKVVNKAFQLALEDEYRNKGAH